jgi:hypothetical protein
MDVYFHFKSTDDSLKLPLITKAITDESVKMWLMAMRANFTVMRTLRFPFLIKLDPGIAVIH